MKMSIPLLAAALASLPNVLSAGDLAGIDLQLVKIVDLPFVPTDLKAPPDGSNRLFALGVTGEIRTIDLETRTVSGPFMQVPDLAVGLGEQAAYSIAFHPEFASNGYFYVHHSVVGDIFAGTSTASRIVRFTATSPASGDPGSKLTIFENQKYSYYHFGGTIEFGPDGLLYMAIGDDEGVGGHPQSLYSLNGKVLRIDVDNPSDGRNYGIPAGNPPIEPGLGFSEILMKGLRNPWRFSFDRETGDFWVADVGEDEWEEISVLSDYASPDTHPDFGWPYYEGLAMFDFDETHFDTEMPVGPIMPVHVYGHTGMFTARSVTGGHVYRGSRFPRMQGVYFFADYITASISGLENDRQWTARELRDFENSTGITTFGEDNDGELYVSLDLEVYHLGDTVETVADTLTVVESGIDESGYFFVTVIGTDGGSLQLHRREDLGPGPSWSNIGGPVAAAGAGPVTLTDTEETVSAAGYPARFYSVSQTLP